MRAGEVYVRDGSFVNNVPQLGRGGVARQGGYNVRVCHEGMRALN